MGIFYETHQMSTPIRSKWQEPLRIPTDGPHSVVPCYSPGFPLNSGMV